MFPCWTAGSSSKVPKHGSLHCTTCMGMLHEDTYRVIKQSWIPGSCSRPPGVMGQALKSGTVPLDLRWSRGLHPFLWQSQGWLRPCFQRRDIEVMPYRYRQWSHHVDKESLEYLGKHNTKLWSHGWCIFAFNSFEDMTFIATTKEHPRASYHTL